MGKGSHERLVPGLSEGPDALAGTLEEGATKLTESVGPPASCPCPAPVLLLNLLQIFIFLRKQNWFSVAVSFS